MRARYPNKILVSTVAIVAMIMPFNHAGVLVAEAQAELLGGAYPVAVVGDVSNTSLTNLVKNTLSEISNAATALSLESLVLKEFTLDGIARNVAQSALNQVTADMIKWVNSGFNGSPAFVTNLGEFLLNVSDKAAGEFISGQALDNLCEPSRFQVKTAALIQYTEEARGTYTPQCTLENVPGVNIEEFVQGDFSKGGWHAFFELTVGNNNDPTKAYLDAITKRNEITQNAKELQQQELGWGDGFLSPKTCETIENATGFSKERCQTTTPGAIIRDALAFHIGEVPALRLLEINEVDQALSGLASSLTNQAISGTFGLLGLGGNSQFSNNTFGNGSQSYADALASVQLQAGVGTSRNPFSEPVAAEEEYAAMQREIIKSIEDLGTEAEDRENESPACFDFELPETLETDLEDAKLNLQVSLVVLEALKELETQYANAPSGAVQNALFEQYQELRAAGLLRTKYENAQLRIEFIDFVLADRLALAQAGIDTEAESCNLN